MARQATFGGKDQWLLAGLCTFVLHLKEAKEVSVLEEQASRIDSAPWWPGPWWMLASSRPAVEQQLSRG